MYQSPTAFLKLAAPHALASALLMLPGCSITNLIGKEKATKTSEFTVPIPESNKCLIRSQNGRIRCVAAAVSEIRVEAELTARAVTVEQAESQLERILIHQAESDGVAEIRAEVPRGVLGSVSFLVTVPTEMSLDLATTNGAIEVTGVLGDVKGVTSNGASSVIDCAGAIDVRTSNGKITLEGDSLANVKARTSNGSVGVKGSLVLGAHEIHTSNGSIKVDLVGPPVTVTATTSNGKMSADGRKFKKGEAVTLGVSDGSSDSSDASTATLSLRTSNGSITITHSGDEEAAPTDEAT